MQCPRCQQDNPTAQKFCGECGTPLKAVGHTDPLAPSYAEVTSALTEALQQQTTTSEILRVISSSPTDMQRVFDAIVQSAARLCNAATAAVFRVEAGMLYHPANYGGSPEALAAARARYPRPVDMDSAPGHAILARSPVQTPDVEDSSLSAHVRQAGEVLGFRSCVAVPMLSGGEAVGALVVTRRTLGSFSDAEVELLKTFADQAVIAIENVRLFNELEARNRDLTESLERETATGEILRVISSSPSDIQPVLVAILDSGRRLCEAEFGAIFRFEDGVFVNAVSTTVTSEFGAWLHKTPIQPGQGTPLRRVGVERRPAQVADMLSDPDFAPPDEYRREGMRTALAVPMLKDGALLGAITFHRRIVKPFTDQQIALLETFAAQAVIAIENVRLFKELESRNAALTNSLEQQTATAEILRVISSSPTELQPVFDTILANACRLCSASLAVLWQFYGEFLIGAAHYNVSPRFAESIMQPARPSRQGPARLAALERRVVHVADMTTEPGYAPMVLQYEGARTVLAVPLLRDDNLVGVVAMWRREVQPFTDEQIALLQTFAAQAVIAIENVRLFTELQEKNRALTQAHAHVSEALERQTATSEILRVISRSPTDTQPVFDTIAASAARLCAARDAQVLRVEGDVLRLVAAYGSPSMPPVRSISRGHGVGRAVIDRQPIHVRDMAEAIRDFPETSAPQHGVQSILAIPLLRNDVAVGVIRVSRTQIEPFTEAQIALLQTFADQAVIAIENVRLFKELQASNREIAEKSRQLEVASQHKSEFLANMSHELRTPLNAIIGFSEVLGERLFGELNAKQEEYLKDIHASGQHLLSLINDILDLSKIEAGRMELELTDFDLPSAIDNALTLVRERAGRRGIALHPAADEGLGQIRADERKIKQVLLNLLSNAIKFTPDGGRIDVRARAVDGSVEVSVSDTGVGIAPEDQEAIFEEFRQVGTADKKVEGTGLGLALSRKFIELHGGRIWVESQVRVGSTFTFRIPVRRAE